MAAYDTGLQDPNQSKRRAAVKGFGEQTGDPQPAPPQGTARPPLDQSNTTGGAWGDPPAAQADNINPTSAKQQILDTQGVAPHDPVPDTTYTSRGLTPPPAAAPSTAATTEAPPYDAPSRSSQRAGVSAEPAAPTGGVAGGELIRKMSGMTSGWDAKPKAAPTGPTGISTTTTPEAMTNASNVGSTAPVNTEPMKPTPAGPTGGTVTPEAMASGAPVSGTTTMAENPPPAEDDIEYPEAMTNAMGAGDAKPTPDAPLGTAEATTNQSLPPEPPADQPPGREPPSPLPPAEQPEHVPPVAPVNAYSRNADKQSLVEQLMARAKQGTAIDYNDPVIKGQTDAYSAQEERARRNFLSDAAESNSPYSTGQQAGLERMTAENMGQRVGQFEADLASRELTARRDEIQQALGQLGSTLTDEEKQGMERELANMNAAIEKAKMGTQNSQFYAGLSQQDKQFVSQLQQGERFHNMDDAFRRMDLAQQQGQFAAKLAQEGKFAEMDDLFRKAQLSQQDTQFLKQLAQTGEIAKLEQEFKRLQLSQDHNQFIAKLAQEGKIADMDDLFRKMQLSQQQSQFLDRLGFDTTQAGNYWDWKNSGGD